MQQFLVFFRDSFSEKTTPSFCVFATNLQQQILILEAQAAAVNQHQNKSKGTERS